MKRVATLLLSWALGSTAACGPTPCEELIVEPLVGSYRSGGTLGEQNLLKVSLQASSKQVVLSFTTKDGSRVRALYRVTKKGTLH
jgi:hypothetical protein